MTDATPAPKGAEIERTQALPAFLSERFSLIPKTLPEAIALSEMMAKSGMVPKCYQGKPADVLVAVQMGLEVNIAPMQALQNIACINGRPCIWGDLGLALVQRTGDMEDIAESYDPKNRMATCRIKRRNIPTATIRTFSWTEAERAGLTKKEGTWQTYPLRMLQMRARWYALRDSFADALKGIYGAEEMEGAETIRDVPVTIIEPQPRAGAPAPATDDFLAPGAVVTAAVPAPAPAPTAAAPDPAQAPKEDPAQDKPAEPKGKKWTGALAEVKQAQSGKGAKGEWILWKLKGRDGTTFGTFNRGYAEAAQEVVVTEARVDIWYTDGKHGKDLVEIRLAEGVDEPAAQEARA